MALLSLARNPVPGGAVTGYFPAYDGRKLRFARWEATRGPRRGTVCLFGGRGEFIEKYFEAVADLRRRGFAVAIMDWRGQGGSERLLDDPMKGHVMSFAEYDADLRRFMKEIVLPDCPPPFMALANSMGGHILLRHAIMPGSWFERMVLTAPMIGIHEQRMGYSEPVVRAYAEVVALLGGSKSYVYGGSPEPTELGDFETNLQTTDRERWFRNRAIIEEAPRLALGSPTVGWLRAAYRSMAMLADPAYPARVQVPILLFTAGKDHIVSNRAIEAFGARLKVGSHLLLPGARHEILQEADAVRLKFWAAFDSYVGIREPEFAR